MGQVHFVLQGKGGVGKSFVASLLIQYLRSKGEPVIAVDTDPVNATLTGYKAYDTRQIVLLQDNRLLEEGFDDLMELIKDSSDNIVIDSGASTFLPLSSYLKENEAIGMILDWGKQLVIHTVITGGQALADTVSGFVALAKQMPEKVGIVVWLNEFFGDIKADGKSFEQMKAYENYRHRVAALIEIPRYTGSTFGQDIQAMLDKKLTFDEAIASPDFRLMSKSRLEKVRDTLFREMEDRLFPFFLEA